MASFATTTEAESLETALVAAARDGDDAAFQRLTDPYVRELRVHCYRIRRGDVEIGTLSTSRSRTSSPSVSRRASRCGSWGVPSGRVGAHRCGGEALED